MKCRYRRFLFALLWAGAFILPGTNVSFADGTVTLTFLGEPNSTNVVQSTTSLTPPVTWQNVSTNLADANGAWQFTDNNNSTRFYRSYAP